VLELVIFVGLPGSGKSTYFREHYAATHMHVSKDLMPRTRDEIMWKQIDTALAAGRSVVVDNTNPSRETRAPFIAIGRRRGAKIVGTFFDVDARTCLMRNREREGRARVPNVAIFATKKKLQVPEIGEGFDELHVITA
jgi:predicted kinase